MQPAVTQTTIMQSTAMQSAFTQTTAMQPAVMQPACMQTTAMQPCVSLLPAQVRTGGSPSPTWAVHATTTGDSDLPVVPPCEVGPSEVPAREIELEERAAAMVVSSSQTGLERSTSAFSLSGPSAPSSPRASSSPCLPQL
jgi:hypothetical protein